MLQYIQELLQQAGHDCHRELSTGRAGQCAGESESGTATDCGFRGQVKVQQDALLVVDRQMSYMRQRLSAHAQPLPEQLSLRREHAWQMKSM